MLSRGDYMGARHVARAHRGFTNVFGNFSRISVDKVVCGKIFS